MRLKRAIFFIAAIVWACVAVARTFAGVEPDSSLVVGKIEVVGNLHTKTEIILREMSLKVGEPLTEEALEYDRDRIYNLQLFTRVEVNSFESDGTATVVVSVDERWYIFPFPVLGFKYHALKNLYYGAGITHQNFRGRNEKIFFSFALGFDRWIELSYANPRISDDDLFLSASINASRLQNLKTELGDYHQQHLGSALTLGKRFGLFQAASVWVGYEVWQVPSSVTGGTLSRGGRDAFAEAGLGYALDTRDLREYTTHGTYVGISVAQYGIGESPVSFSRLGLEARQFILLPGRIILGLRTHGAFTIGGTVPPYRFVYLGYEERVRGAYNTVVEGEHRIGGNVELRVPILEPTYFEVPAPFLREFRIWRFGLYGALFADAGKAWYRAEAFGSRRWYSGFGAGLHLLLPYSIVVRAEYALNPKFAGEWIFDLGTPF